MRSDGEWDIPEVDFDKLYAYVSAGGELAVSWLDELLLDLMMAWIWRMFDVAWLGGTFNDQSCPRSSQPG